VPLKSRSFAVIGLGNFGSTVAAELTRFGNYVIGVDIDKKIVADLSDQLSHVVIVDGRDEVALKEAGVAECDVGLVAMGEDLESSILSAINLKVIGVEEVWAKAVSRTHHRILSRLGVDRVIHPEEQMGYHVAQRMHNPMVRDYVSLGNGLYVVNVIVPEVLDGQKLGDLNLDDRFSLRCIGVMRGTDFVGQQGQPCTLATDDRMLLLGRRQDLRDFAASL
jgi:trk system potassium uptake protein TrkA